MSFIAAVKILGMHSGVLVGPDGATHQMLEDIAPMRVLPNVIVVKSGRCRGGTQNRNCRGREWSPNLYPL
jgi:transketolase